jgi:hypothetical protein
MCDVLLTLGVNPIVVKYIYTHTHIHTYIYTHTLQPNISVFLFVRFAHTSYGRFIAICYKVKRSTYIQEPLVIGRRDFVQREI